MAFLGGTPIRPSALTRMPFDANAAPDGAIKPKTTRKA